MQKPSEKHAALERLLDRSRFVGIRVFGPDKAPIYETWADIPPVLINTVRFGQHQHDWPEPEQSHLNWINAARERIIQVVLPMFSKDEKLASYLECIDRFDETSLQAQREQVRNGALTASLSVVVTALLLYPLLLSVSMDQAILADWSAMRFPALPGYSPSSTFLMR